MVEVYKRDDLSAVTKALAELGYTNGKGAEFTHPKLDTVTLLSCGDSCFVSYGVRQSLVPSKALAKKAYLQMADVNIDKVANTLKHRTGVRQLTDDWYTLEGGLIWCNLSSETYTVYLTAYATGDTVKHMLSVAIMLRDCYM